MDFVNISDPISGFIFIPKTYLKIIDSFEVQRLRRIKQLSGTPLVYPGANHTRFEHSIGVMSLVRMQLDTLIKGNEIELDDSMYNSAILAGLCHDLGHGPFSHNFEEILRTQIRKSHEDFTRLIILKSELGDLIEELGYDKKIIADLASGNYNNPKFIYLNQIITGPVNCDSRDYLMRDAYHCGTGFNSVDIQRLMTISGITENNYFGFHVKGTPTIESFLIARMNAFRSIYFHKTSRAVQIMLGEALKIYGEETGAFKFSNNDEDIQKYLELDDVSVYYQLLKHESTKEIMEKLRRRKIIKTSFEIPFNIQKDREQFKKKNLEKYKEDIGKIAKISPDKIFIDFPFASSIPYHENIESSEVNIPIYSIKTKNGKRLKELMRFEEISLLYKEMKGYFNLIRVYTNDDNPVNRERVKEASKKVLVGLTLDEWV